MTPILIFKLTATPFLILGLTLLTRRFGPVAGGIAMGIPLTTGPISVFVALEHGAGFAADAAVTNLAGQLSTGIFCLAYAIAARRVGPLTSALCGNFAFLVTTALWMQVSWSIWSAAATLVLGLVILATVFPRTGTKRLTDIAPRWDTPVRMVVATGFVLAITGLSPILGARLSGLIAPVPVLALIIAVFTHHSHGGAAATALLRGVILGSPAFGAFFIVTALCLPILPVGPTYVLAIWASVAVSSVAWVFLSRQPWAEHEYPRSARNEHARS